jgi:hypothetical protein
MGSASSLLLDAYFEAGDERFVDEVLASIAGKKLRGLADRWYGDARPFARRALLRYIDDGCDRPHHRPLVKALFKLAELAGDDEAMGHFLVAFDRLVRRRLRPLQRWNKATQAAETVQVFRGDPTVPIALGDRESKAPRFSRRTRLYLVRRAFRYFRVLAREDGLVTMGASPPSPRYGPAIRAALVLYEDRHLQTVENVLDAWGLVHALYWSSPVLVRDPQGIRVAKGRAVAELAPAPFAPESWQGALHGILDLVVNARSRPVRVFAITLLRQDYADALRGMPLARVRALLRSPHDEVQVFAAELLKETRGASSLTVGEWLELLAIENPLALPLLCEMVIKAVSPDRLTLAQCVGLACARAAPVAELGLAWARKKPVSDAEGIAAALGVIRAGVPHVRAEGTAWVAELLARPFAAPEHVRTLLDARFAEPRAAAFALIEGDGRFRESTVLWGALAESPYADARAFLVRHLGARLKSFAPETLRQVWATSLLAVHRGGRAKRGALNQIADRIAERPAEAEVLLPLLAIALRSVRAPERRTALAAVARAAVREPALRGAIARALPELKLLGEVAA